MANKTATDLELFIEETMSYFEQVLKGDNYITTLKRTRPEALHNSVFKAHGNRLPNDWIYQTYEAILSNLSGYGVESIDDIEDNRHEIVDGLVDVYTYDLERWIADGNSHYITEALREYGIDDAPTDGFKILQISQYKAIDDIFSEVISYLSENFERAKNYEERKIREGEIEAELRK